MTNQEQKTILLVEDETVTMMVETHQLQSFGYDVVPAKSGEEAVQIATGNDKIALVLMDVNLGSGMDGTEAAKQILGKRNLPIVFLSSHTDKEYVERIKGIAGYGYIVKNSSDVVLHSSIEMALNLFEVQEAMREREALHLNLLAKLPAGIIIIDPLTRTIESVNARAAAMFGVAAEQIVGHRCHSFLCPAQEKNCPVLDLGQEVDYSERMMLHADGSRHPVLKSVTRIQLCGQEKLLECFVDITEHKKAEETIRKAKEDWDRTFNSVPDLITLIDEKHTITRVNRAMADLLGVKPEEAIGRKCYTCIHNTDQPPDFCPHVQLLNDGKEHEAEIKEEKLGKWLHITVSPLRNDAGDIVGAVHVARDITKRKKAEEALWESRKRFQGLVETLYDWVWEVDCQGRYIYVSPRIKDILGYEPEEILGKTPFELMPPEEAQRVSEIFRPLLAEQKPIIVLENINLYKNGHPVILETSGLPFYDAKGNFKGYRGTDRDITEHKKAEEALHLFKDLVEHSSDAIGMSTPDGRHYYQNEAFNCLFGDVGDCPPETLYVDQAIGKQVFNSIMGGRSWQGELQMFKKDRTILDILLRAYAIQNQDGRIIGLVGLHTDITMRKRAEEALRKSERSLAITFSSIGDAVIATDAQGRIVRMNRVAEQLTGWPLKEALGRPLDEVFHIINQHTRLPLENPVAKVLETGKTQGLSNDTVLVSRQGVEFIIADSAAAIMDDQTGKAVGVVLVFRDQTKEHTAAEELRESRQRFQGLVETLYDWVWEVDPQGHYTYISPRIRDILGYEPEEFLGKTPFDLMPAEEAQRVSKIFGPLVAEQKPVIALENTNLHKDGHPVIMETNGLPLYDAQGKFKGYRGTDRDITERKEMQGKLLVSEKLAVMGRMVADVSHELNNPLAIIAGNTSLLEKMAKEQATSIPDSENNAKRFKKIQKAINRCKIIMASLLVSTRPTMLDIKPIDMNKIIEESLESMDDRLKSQNVKVVKAFTPCLPIIEADGHRLGQVFINMFSNACDAMPEGGELRIATRLHTPGKATGKEGPAIEIEISDTGEGIGEDDLFKIFDPFVTTKMDGKGVGLGLSISSGIVREHGGDISVTSKKGKGATFVIKIPAKREQAGNKNE